MRQQRYELLRDLGCIACLIQASLQCGPVEAHHQNLGGYAGQARLGDAFTIPLGLWHHRGISHWGHSPTLMAAKFGPSLKLQSKAFRAKYGTDEELLALVNERLETL